MRYQHIVWDWNGTLLDDLWLCIDSINSVLSSRNMKLVNKKSYRSIFTFPVIKYYEILGFDFKNESFPIPGFLNYYNNYFEKCRLHLDAQLVLEKNKNNGLSQSVLSAGKQDSLLEWVKYHNIDYYFNDLIGIENDKAEGKTEAGINWISKSKISKNKILMVGDTIHDSEVAERLGIDCVLVSIGHVNKSRLLKTGRKVFDSLDSLPHYIYNS